MDWEFVRVHNMLGRLLISSLPFFRYAFKAYSTVAMTNMCHMETFNATSKAKTPPPKLFVPRSDLFNVQPKRVRCCQSSIDLHFQKGLKMGVADGKERASILI